MKKTGKYLDGIRKPKQRPRPGDVIWFKGNIKDVIGNTKGQTRPTNWLVLLVAVLFFLAGAVAGYLLSYTNSIEHHLEAVKRECKAKEPKYCIEAVNDAQKGGKWEIMTNGTKWWAESSERGNL